MGMICYNCFHEKSSYGPCPICGYDPSGDAEKYPLALKPGSILGGRYIVGRVLGQGGFGITYIAQDYKRKVRVAIKEYLPTDFAGRDHGSSFVQIYSGERKNNFEYGKEQFLSEAKTLAAFNGDAHIVRIYSYFEENNTAYFVMEYVDGYALDKYMAQKGGRLSVDESSRLLLPVMESLEKVHAKGIIHRDIAPDNLIITKDGTAKLIDFGAARYSTGEKSRSLDVILKHGFAPGEQYMRRGRQGPFTDVYAFAATWYYAITGKVPPDAVERMQEDTILMPNSLGAKISADAEEVLMKALEVKAQERYQTMAEFSAAMEEATRREREQSERKAQKEAERQERGRKWKKRIREIWETKSKTFVAIVAVLLAAVIAVGYFVLSDSDITEKLAKEKALRSARVGDIICFGSYEQDNDLENGKEGIEWIVLDREKDRILVISRYGLDSQPYNSTRDRATWETCSLRKWLNERFLKEAFSTEEQARIPTVTVTAGQNPEYHHNSQGNDTTDKVFLLSIQEAKNYFLSDEERQCSPTAYAKAQGVKADVGGGNCFWWLRSLGNVGRASDIGYNGSIYMGGVYIISTYFAVRPAMWIDISRRSGVYNEPTEVIYDPKNNSIQDSFRTVGHTVTFGSYEQDNDLVNGKEPIAIEWIVLDIYDRKSLLISKYGLDCQPYNITYPREVTWETYSLRKWLNESFQNEAFS